MIPDSIIIDSAFFGPKDINPDEGDLQGRVIAILRDSTGDQYCVFELPDTAGLHIIHLGSTFFRRFTVEPNWTELAEAHDRWSQTNV